MTDFSIWPLAVGRKASVHITVPKDWLDQFRRDCLDIRLLSAADNDSHAIAQAVHEMAERLRENGRDD